MTLYELTEELYRLYEFAEDPEIDEEVFRDTLEALQGDIEVKADGYGKVIRQLDADKKALDAEIERLTARKTAIDNRKKVMTEALYQAFKALDTQKLKTDLFTFYIQKNPVSVVIDDPEGVPDEFYKVKKELSKTSIKEAIEGGQNLSFAHLEQSESIRMR